MSIINRKVQENALKCDSCKFNLVNDFNLKRSNAEAVWAEKRKATMWDETVFKASRATMWASCKFCPNKKDFEKIYGVEPVAYYSSLFS